jgi:hypothetical protein
MDEFSSVWTDMAGMVMRDAHDLGVVYFGRKGDVVSCKVKCVAAYAGR